MTNKKIHLFVTKATFIYYGDALDNHKYEKYNDHTTSNYYYVSQDLCIVNIHQ